jgi:hypothetical protein
VITSRMIGVVDKRYKSYQSEQEYKRNTRSGKNSELISVA